MGIKMVENVGAPLAVTAVDLLTLVKQPTWNEGADYAMTAIGYIVAALGLGGRTAGEFCAGLATASLPLTARHIYNRVAPGAAMRVAPRMQSRIAFNPIAHPVSRAYQPEFEQAGAKAF